MDDRLNRWGKELLRGLSFVSFFDMYLRTISSFISNLPYAGWYCLDYRAQQVVIPPSPHERLLLFVCWLLHPPHPSRLHSCFPSPSWLSRKQESSVPWGAAACGSNAYMTSPDLFTSKAEPIVQGVRLQPYFLRLSRVSWSSATASTSGWPLRVLDNNLLSDRNMSTHKALESPWLE